MAKSTTKTAEKAAPKAAPKDAEKPAAKGKKVAAPKGDGAKPLCSSR
jgi:upstream activation factor subunit UAF30